MNVVGYICEPSSAESGDTMFAQSERIRRWIARNGHQLVAVCQDTATTRRNLDGFRALLGIAARGQADLVVIPGLPVLSPDKVVQEMMLMRLRSHGLAVASTEEADQEELSEPTADPARMLIRDILHRIDDYRPLLEADPEIPPPVALPGPVEIFMDRSDPQPPVLIEFMETPAAS